MTSHLIEVKNLITSFMTERGKVTAVDGVSFHVKKGETLAIVGESGCGKSVTAQSIMRLLEEKGTTSYEGAIQFNGENLLNLSINEMRHIRGNKISMIFQDPLSSLNPVYTIGNQIMEPLMLHQNLKRKSAYKKAIEMLKLIGIPAPEKRIDEYPHELSGGMQQRIMIAIALSCQPQLLIADEPTTALDVTIQMQILDLIEKLKEEFNMGIIFITHDLGVVAQYADRVAVMYLGEIVEEGSVKEIFNQPIHPYTKGLIESIPRLTGTRGKRLHTIRGMVPSLYNIPEGCRFAPRCEFADENCMKISPKMYELGDGHNVKCYKYKEISSN